MTETAAAEYAAGAAAARHAIALIEPTVTPEAMRALAVQNIIPIHVTDRSAYDHGSSDVWGDWQAQSTRAARKWRGR
jgi:hypothetical protein